MFKRLFLLFIAFLSLYTMKANDKEKSDLINDIVLLKQKIDAIDKKIKSLSYQDKKLDILINRNVNSINKKISNLEIEDDSIQRKIDSLADIQNTKIDNLSSKSIEDFNTTNSKLEEGQKDIENRSFWGIIIASILLLILLISIYFIRRKFRKESNSLEQIRKAQSLLESTQKQLYEESCSIDNKLLSIIETQINENKNKTNIAGVKDHSLALKVADEIVRIELNLSRMDSSVKGYKQLSKAVQRIKDNFFANGYEIVDMLGKPYNDGMKVIANFVVDETIESGKQIITGITKPQINFGGEMIQAAQIVVSQNI